MSSAAKVPETVTLLICPVCGRDDRFRPFTGKRHFNGGEPCEGQPIRWTYRLEGKVALDR